jgi:hypothetical protein
MGRRRDDADVVEAQAAVMRTGPVPRILAAQNEAGFWLKPGAGYSPKYRGTVWQLIQLYQLGSDPADARVQTACEYVLAHTQTQTGGFGASGGLPERPPSPSNAYHCLNGNLLLALIGLGRLSRAPLDHDSAAA